MNLKVELLKIKLKKNKKKFKTRLIVFKYSLCPLSSFQMCWYSDLYGLGLAATAAGDHSVCFDMMNGINVDL